MTDFRQIQGDVFHVLNRLLAASCHGCLADPPYGWNFMGRAWDRTEAVDVAVEESLRWFGLEAKAIRPVLWNVRWLREIHRILVPGAYAAIFTGSKSYDLVAFAGRLAGFEVQPMLTGVVGSAMAHGADVSKAIDREAGAEREDLGVNSSVAGRRHTRRMTADGRSTFHDETPTASPITAPATPLAESFEGHRTRYRDQLLPICVLLKPPEGSYAQNARRWGVGGYAIDACRVATTDSLGGGANAGRACFESIGLDRPAMHSEASRSQWAKSSQASTARSEALGRVPGNCLLLTPEAEAEVGRQSGERHPGISSGGNRTDSATYGRTASAQAGTYCHEADPTAARYFPRFRYTARAAEQERLRGCEGFLWVADSSEAHGWRRVESREWLETEPRRRLQGTIHTTLKPLELCRWLARLIMPPPPRTGPEYTADNGRPTKDVNHEAERIRIETTGSPNRLLVPFSGVLSEAIGAALAGFPEIVAIEQEAAFIEQGAARMRAWGPYEPARAEAIERSGGLKEGIEHRQLGLFASPAAVRARAAVERGEMPDLQDVFDQAVADVDAGYDP